jgi:hypothetical protein
VSKLVTLFGDNVSPIYGAASVPLYRGNVAEAVTRCALNAHELCTSAEASDVHLDRIDALPLSHALETDLSLNACQKYE